MDTMQAGLDKLRAEVAKLDTAALQARVEAMFSALQSAQIVATVPGVAPVADTIAAGAGFKDMAGQDPNLPQPAIAQQPAQPMPPMPQADPQTGAPINPHGLNGVQGGMQTPTGADNGPSIPPQGAPQ